MFLHHSAIYIYLHQEHELLNYAYTPGLELSVIKIEYSIPYSKPYKIHMMK